MRLIIDGNAYLNMSLLRGVDHEFGRVVKDDAGKEVQVNSAGYGVDGFWDRVKGDLAEFGVAPRAVAIVWDGENSKLRRRTYLPQYKTSRDKHPEVSAELNAARARVTEQAFHLGMHVLHQPQYEADDVIGHLCKHMRDQPNVVCTVDGDLSVLCDENTTVWRMGERNVNPYGPFPHKYITLYKSLVGDTSDKIPGAQGFGPEAWLNLVAAIGLDGLDELIEMITNDKLDELKDLVDQFPAKVKLGAILKAKDMVTTSWRVASLHVDEVNTLRRPLHIKPGMVAQWDTLSEDMRVYELKEFYGTTTLVTAANYQAALKAFERRVGESPFVALDIETSEAPESAEWQERLQAITENKRERLDVLGHELTSMGLTFGANTQHTIYMSVDHADTDNITVDQCRELVELIPQTLHTVIQNRQFEFSVLYRTWGDKWKDNGWHGFVPNAIDTTIGAAYVDENQPRGLKFRSLHHLGYKQATYEETTRRRMLASEKGPKGRVVKSWRAGLTGDESVELELHDWIEVEYRMNELTAQEVIGYGADDPICTAALHTHYQFVMELEQTWRPYIEVEQLPEYLTSLAFVQGFPISLERLMAMERKDEERYAAAWSTLKEYLLQHGWTGTVCPVYTEITPAAVKEACALLLDTEEVQFTTKKRKLVAMAADIREQFPDEDGQLVAAIVEKGAADELSALVKANFTGDPKINFGSPKQMQHLFYEVIGVEPRIFNKLTDKQREDPVYASAWKKKRQAKDGKEVTYTPEERAALISKASTDDVAVKWALAKDELPEDVRKVLKAYESVKSILTRRGLFYKPYKALPHWRDGRIHPSLNQSEAATLRYSSSSPNVQQLPKLGEGGEFRNIVLPHKKNAVVVSLDFSGQELRDMAEWSGDENLTACYVGDDLKDAHSLTAVAAAPMLWKQEVTYAEFLAMLKSEDKAVAGKAKLLRADGKTTNFATQYDAMAPKIAETLMTDEETAQAFIDAKDRAFPRIEQWKASVREELMEKGYVTNRDGARRHLREQILGDNKWEAQKAGRQGPNFKIQSSGAGQTKRAMASMWRRNLFTTKYDAVFYAPIHDEVVFSVAVEDAVECIREVHQCMTQPYGGKKIPIVSSISLGPSFGEQTECGDFFDEEKIRSVLYELFPQA